MKADLEGLKARARAVAAQARRGSRFAWPVVGLGAVLGSGLLLLRDLHGLDWDDVGRAVEGISALWWTLAVGSTLVAYAALAWYDRIALGHLGFTLPWRFISAVSFTSYALSHTIGFSVFSGAVVRYRAYSTKGLTMAEVGGLVAFCSFTFGLGTVLLGGLVLLLEPDALAELMPVPPVVLRVAGAAMLAGVALYALGSLFRLEPFQLGRTRVAYPRPDVVARQLVAGPLELLGAAGIIYCALPAADHVGFVVVLAVFLASFSAALLSHAPGGLGVLELVFVTALPDVAQADVLAALLVFRLLYLIVPLGFGLVAVVAFERARLRGRL